MSANWTAHINLDLARVTQCIPKADASIGSPSAAGQNTMLMRRPRDNFHTYSVFGKVLNRLRGVSTVNHVQVIIVTPGSQKSGLIKRSLQATYFLCMSCASSSREIRRSLVVSLVTCSTSDPFLTDPRSVVGSRVDPKVKK
jgi:hypothetical protein